MSKVLSFKVNQYITLFLNDDKTEIFLSGKKFLQCKFLLLKNIHLDEMEEFLSNISKISIDEQDQQFSKSLEGNFNIQKFNISPEEEFRAHCSNLQVWAENGYNSQLLHRNLAFPLLKSLFSLGDPNAKNVFLEEIAQRFESAYLPVVLYLLKENYLDYLPNEYLGNLVISKKSFCNNLLLNSFDSKELIEGQLLSYYLFDIFYPFLSKNSVNNYIKIIKADKNRVEHILFSPNMLTPAPKIYVDPRRLNNLRLALVLNILEQQNFREFNTTELGRHDYLIDELNYRELLEFGEKIRQRERIKRKKTQETNP